MPRLLIACALLQTVAAQAADLPALLDALAQIRNESDVPAYALTLVSRDQVLHANAYGISDRATSTPATSRTRFRIGSITKTFTALAIVIAAQRGELDLNAEFESLAGPELINNPWADHVPIRLSHLLEHSAGLADLNREEMFHSDPTPLRLATAVHTFRRNRVARWHPGQYYAYSNAGAGLAAYALERATGRRYETYVADELFAPLGMRSASILLDGPTQAALARGYDSDKHTPIPYWHMLFRPFGAINATAADMAPFIRLFLNDGVHDGHQLVDAAMIRRMERSETTLAARHGLKFGYGLGLYSWFHQGQRFTGHGGDGDGYLAHFGYNRDSGLGYCIIINAFTPEPLRRMRETIENFIAAQAPAPHLPPPDAAALPPTGAYAAATSRFGSIIDLNRPALMLETANGALYSRRPDAQPRLLLPAGQYTWRHADESEATVAIMPNAAGQWIFHGMRETFIRIEPTPSR